MSRAFTCREMVELVTDYLENKLSRGDRKAFEKHIAGCPGCSRYLEQMRLTIKTLGRIESRHLSAAAKRELLDAFRDWKG